MAHLLLALVAENAELALLWTLRVPERHAVRKPLDDGLLGELLRLRVEFAEALHAFVVVRAVEFREQRVGRKDLVEHLAAVGRLEGVGR